MKPPAPLRANAIHQTLLAHDQHGLDDRTSTSRSETRFLRSDDERSNGNESQRDSDRSSSHSTYSEQEQLSEHMLESVVSLQDSPQSQSALPMHRHKSRISSGHFTSTTPEYTNVLAKEVGNFERQVPTPPPPGSVLHISDRSFVQPPHPIPPSRHSTQPGDHSSSGPSVPEMSPLQGLERRTHRKRTPPPPQVAPPPPPPPPPRSNRRRSQSARRVRQPAKHRKERRSKYASDTVSIQSGSSTYSYRKGRQARRNHTSSREGSRSTDDSDIDPISARNARVFPPRLPAAMTRGRPPTQSTAIHNITSWFHRNTRERKLMLSPDLNFLRPAPPPPPGPGAARNGAWSTHEGSDSDESEGSNASLADRIEHLWQTLKEKRSRVAEVKSEMSQLRRELRNLRRKRDDADNALMNILRPMLVNPRNALNMSSVILRERLSEVQDLWNDYNHREASYEGQEILLDEEEEALNYTEIRFFTLLAAGRSDPDMLQKPQDRVAVPHYPSDVPFELRGISRDGPAEGLHPTYIKLTAAVGDWQNCKEEHAEVRAEREALEEDIALKRSTGQDVPLDMIRSVELSLREEERLAQEAESMRVQTEKLKYLCEKGGLMRKHMSIGMQYILEPTLSYEQEIDLEEHPPVSNPLRHPTFAGLLTQPDHVMAEPLPLTTEQALKEAAILPLEDPRNRDSLRVARKEHSIERLLLGKKDQSKPEFVNRWMLQILQLSPLQVSCLHDTFISSSRLQIRNPALWQKDVLHYWFRDGTLIEHNEEELQESAGNKRAGSVDEIDAATPPLSRAESAPLVVMSPLSLATDDSTAKTLDGSSSFFLPAVVGHEDGDGDTGRLVDYSDVTASHKFDYP